MWFRRVVVFALLGVAAAGCSRPSESSAVSRTSAGSAREQKLPLPLDPNVSVGTLDNGVEYVIQPLPNTGDAARLVLVVRAGSLEEVEGERGFAHFVEHVATDPAQRFGELAPSELLARLGETLGADSNAEAHFTHTQYFLTAQSADAEVTAQVLAALAGWASQVQFTPEVVERQRPIVLAELRSSESQKSGVVGELKRFLMDGLGIAERGPLGAQADLQAATPARLEAFYRRWYVPQNLTVVATGEFDRGVLTEQIQRFFSALPPQPEWSRLARWAARRPQQALVPAEKWLFDNASEGQLPGGVATSILQLPAGGVQFEQDYQADLIDRYLCVLLEERLRQPPQRGRFECAPARPGAEQVQLRLRAWANPRALRTSVEALLLELQRSLQLGFLEAELRRAAPRMAELLAQETRASTTVREASKDLVNYAIGEQPLLSGSQKQELEGRLLRSITPAALMARAREWLTQGRHVLLAIREEEDTSLTSKRALDELARELQTRALPPPREPAPEVPLMAVLPERGKVAGTQHIEEPGLHVWTLDNGAQVVFKPGRRGSDGALLRGLFSARSGASSTEDSSTEEKQGWSRTYAPLIVQRSGAGAHDPRALSQLLSSKTTKVQLGPDVDAASSARDFETTLQLLHLYLTAPRRDPGAFEHLVSELLRPAPHQAFVDAMFPALEPRVGAEQLDLDAALKAHQDRYGDVSGVQFVIVADVEEDRVRGLVEQYLASLPGGPSAPGSPGSSQQTPSASRPESARSGVQRVRVPNRPGAESQVVLRFGGPAVPSPEARIEVEALEGYLRLRLREVLQQQLGAIYDVEVTSGWSGNHTWHQILFECRPADVERLQRATLEVIAGIEQPGISEADLEALRAEHAAQFPRAFHEDGFWLEELAHAYGEDAPPRRILELPNLSAHITREALRLSARRSLRLDSYVDAVWTPASLTEAR